MIYCKSQMFDENIYHFSPSDTCNYLYNRTFQQQPSTAFTVTAVQWLIVFNRGVNMATFNEKNLLFDLCCLKIWYTSFISMNEFQTLSFAIICYILIGLVQLELISILAISWLSAQDRKSLQQQIMSVKL